MEKEGRKKHESRPKKRRKKPGEASSAFSRRHGYTEWNGTEKSDAHIKEACKEARLGRGWGRALWTGGRQEGEVCVQAILINFLYNLKYRTS